MSFIIDQLISLRKQIGDCQKCSLGSTRKNLVFGEGFFGARMIFIGEGPGQQEDEQGRPFVGRSGHLLEEGLLAAGLSRDEIYITNIVMCRPPENRVPTPEETQTCSPFLRQKINLISPELLVALGRTSAEYLLQRPIKITQERGNLFPYPFNAGIKVMPVFHPSYVLRNRTKEIVGLFFQDLKNAKEFANEKQRRG